MIEITNKTTMAVMEILPEMNEMTILALMVTMAVILDGCHIYIDCYGNSCSYENIDCNCHNSCNGHKSCNNCIGCNGYDSLNGSNSCNDIHFSIGSSSCIDYN